MSAVDPIKPPTARSKSRSVSSTAIDRAGIHLYNAGAIADLVQVLADCDDGEALGNLINTTLANAMYCIRYHVEAAQELQQQFASQVMRAQMTVHHE